MLFFHFQKVTFNTHLNSFPSYMMNFTVTCEVRNITHTRTQRNPGNKTPAQKSLDSPSLTFPTYILLTTCKAHQWFPKFGSITSNISITWRLVKNAISQVLSQTYRIRTLGVCESGLTNPPDDSDGYPSLGTTATEWFTGFVNWLDVWRSEGVECLTGILCWFHG